MNKKETEILTRALRELGRRGGFARAARLTAKERTESARKAGRARQAQARMKRGGAR